MITNYGGAVVKVLDATNLLGDSIYLLKPIQEYIKKNGTEKLVVVAHPGISFEMFDRCFGYEVPVLKSLDDAVTYADDEDLEVLKLQAGLASDVSIQHKKETGQRLHIADSYAKMLDVVIPEINPLMLWADEENSPVKEYILVSPFSRSCSRHSGLPPNKTLDDWKWNNILTYLRKQYPVKVMGAPGDRLEKVVIADNDYLCASTLSGIQEEILKAHFVVTVDNGIGHIAAALGVPTIILWPLASDVDFIGEIYAANVYFIFGFEPTQITPAAILFGLKTIIKEIMNGKSSKAS